jgi:hypothetical protein
VPLSSSNGIHERYEEMCAVAAIGELPDWEFDELQNHISACRQCRELYREFCRISAHDLGTFAAPRQCESSKFAGTRPINDLLAKCIARAEIERLGRSSVPASSSLTSQKKDFFTSLLLFSRPRQRKLAYIVAGATLIVASGLVGFETGQRQLRPTIGALRESLSQIASETANASSGRPTASQTGVMPAVDQAEKLALRLKARSEQYGLLAKEKKQLQDQLASASARIDAFNAQALSYQTRWQQEHTARTDLQTQLSDTQEQLGKEEQALLDLDGKLRRKEQELTGLASKELPNVENGEAKSLFGARDLHIVDVYDVDGHGNTQRSFGRVYYVEKKLLLFYAFDLEDKKHNRATAGFQAWGYKEANADKPENLGLFYVDDASLNRWVLKVNNPKVLEHVEVVFVTLEPPQGSSTPKGRRLLYANLGGAPNHP